MNDYFELGQHVLPTTFKLLVFFERIVPATLMGMAGNAVVNLLTQEGLTNRNLMRKAGISFFSGITVAFGVSLLSREPDVAVVVAFVVAISGKDGMLTAQKFFLVLLTAYTNSLAKNNTLTPPDKNDQPNADSNEKST